MANIREIQSRINSVKDTMKITNAMYMISSSKMTHAKKKTCGYRALLLWPARRNIENTQTFAGLASWIFFGARECSGRRAQDRFDRYYGG